MDGLGCVLALVGVLIVGGGIYFIGNQSSSSTQQVATTNSASATTLAERKAEMLRQADVVVALPGSFGTWDELFDALALRKIKSGGHKSPVGVLNVKGYFDPLLHFIQHSVDIGFTSSRYAGLLKSGKTPDELFNNLLSHLVQNDKLKR